MTLIWCEPGEYPAGYRGEMSHAERIVQGEMSDGFSGGNMRLACRGISGAMVNTNTDTERLYYLAQPAELKTGTSQLELK